MQNFELIFYLTKISATLQLLIHETYLQIIY